jgi:hypothetical protein
MRKIVDQVKDNEAGRGYQQAKSKTGRYSVGLMTVNIANLTNFYCFLQEFCLSQSSTNNRFPGKRPGQCGIRLKNFLSNPLFQASVLDGLAKKEIVFLNFSG